jgi:nitrate reductase gamma subunit
MLGLQPQVLLVTRCSPLSRSRFVSFRLDYIALQHLVAICWGGTVAPPTPQETADQRSGRRVRTPHNRKLQKGDLPHG